MDEITKMKIEEVREIVRNEHKKLEAEINRAIGDFEKNTGFTVLDIDVWEQGPAFADVAGFVN